MVVFLENALIVSHSDNGLESIAKMLKLISCKKIATAKTCGEARRLSLENSYDLYIINSPVQNDTGKNLAKEIVSYGVSQVIFIVKTDLYESMSSQVEDGGVITIPKPINKNMLWVSLKIAKATNSRLKNMQKINTKLTRKIEDIKIVDRAKYLLISYLSMSEEEAHKYIEKKAMDTRVSRREVAEDILKTYEN